MKTLTNILGLIIILFSVINTANAQTQKFDVMTYTPPKGWTVGQNGQAKTFTTVDKTAGKFCMMFLYPSVTNHGTPSQDFAYVWKTLVQETFNASANPETQVIESDGFKVITGGELIEYEGSKALAMLTTVSGKGKVISLLSIFNDAKYADDVQAFLGAIDVDIKETPKQIQKQLPNQANTTLGDGEKFDLWMTTSWGAYKPLSREYSLTEAKVEWFIVYPNGDWYPHLPDEGFLNFSRANLMSNPEKAKSWGKLTFTGNKGRFKSIYDEIEVVKLSPTQMEKPGSIFKINKVVPVDNLRLSGAFSLGSPNANYAKPGCQSVIHFTKDGRFDDRGIFISCDNIGRAYLEDNPGVGTYQLKNFTVILQYNDGRVKTRAFSGGPGVSISTHNDMIYIGGNAYFKN